MTSGSSGTTMPGGMYGSTAAFSVTKVIVKLVFSL